MLENQNVDWASLGHAYGSAEDTPAHLQALTSEDTEARASAMGFLYGAILHQGTIYPATAAVVMHLIDLLEQPQVPDRSALAEFLSMVSQSLIEYVEDVPADTTGNDNWTQLTALPTQTAFLNGVPVLLRLLEHPGASLRLAACRMLRCTQVRRSDVEPVLRTRWLLERDPNVRLGLLETLIRFWRASSKSGASPTTHLALRRVALADHEPAGVRLLAVHGLLRGLGTAALPELQPVIVAHLEAAGQMFATPEHAAFMYGWSVFSAVDDPDVLFDLLRSLLQHTSDQVRAQASSELAVLARADRMIAERAGSLWAGLLLDPNEDIQWQAMASLSEFRRAARECIDVLLKALQSGPNPQAAALALARIREPRALPILAERLHDPNEWYSMQEVLKAYGPVAAPLVPTLLEVLDSNGVPKAIQEISHLISDTQYKAIHRLNVVQMLATIGHGAREAIPTLHAMFMAALHGHRMRLLYALMAIDASALPIETLVSLLTDHQGKNDTNTASDAWMILSALQACGPRASMAVPTLRSLLEDDEDHIRFLAAAALGAIGAEHAAAQAEFEAVLAQELASEANHNDQSISAFEGLASLGSTASSSLPWIEHGVRHHLPSVRCAAAWAHHRVTGQTTLAVPVFVETCQTAPDLITLKRLGQIGPEAHPAIPVLRALLDSRSRAKGIWGRPVDHAEQDEHLCEAALQTLACIEPRFSA